MLFRSCLLAGLGLLVPGLLVPAALQIFVNDYLGNGDRGWLWPLAGGMLAAAAVLTVVTTAQVLAGRSDAPEVEAEVALAPLEGDASGRARLVRLPDGRHRLRLDERVAALPPGSYLELWLIDPDSGLQRMVSLGVAEDGTSAIVPDGIDPTVYRLVDVSIEQADGNPAHSGRSVLRGTLEV